MKSPKKGKEEKTAGKGKKAEAEVAADEGPPPPQPGSDDWIFVDRPIDTVQSVICRHNFIIIVHFFLFRHKLMLC